MSEKGKPGVMLYFDFWHGLKKLGADDKGRLVDGIVEYSETGSEPTFDGTLAIVWDLAKLRVDADSERYSVRCERQRENAMKRWNKSNDATACRGKSGNAEIANDAKYNATTNTTTNTTANTNVEYMSEKPPRKRFVPPTFEEVKEYCEERKNDVNPQRFIDHYTARGWMLGKIKMQDWKAAVRTWEGSGNNRISGSTSTSDRGEEVDLFKQYGLKPDVCG